MIKVVCFDLDGTLVNSKEVIFRTFDYVFSTLFPEHRENNLIDYRKYMGPLLEETFGLYTNNNETITKAVETYINYYKTIELQYLKSFNNINSTLKWLKDNNIKICLLTNKRMSSSLPSLNMFDIYNYFDFFITSDIQGQFPKPNRYPIDLASKEFGVDNSQIIMVGDNEVDIFCGINANAHTALVSYNEWFNDVLNIVKPEFVLNDMSDLINIIIKENNL